jgi:hypothetical protein
MVRLQITIDDDEDAAVRAIAAHEGISVSEVIRRELRPLLESEIASEEDPLLAMIGKYASPEGSPTNLAEKHDTFLYGSELATSGQRDRPLSLEVGVARPFKGVAS